MVNLSLTRLECGSVQMKPASTRRTCSGIKWVSSCAASVNKAYTRFRFFPPFLPPSCFSTLFLHRLSCSIEPSVPLSCLLLSIRLSLLSRSRSRTLLLALFLCLCLFLGSFFYLYTCISLLGLFPYRLHCSVLHTSKGCAKFSPC